jgi:hypothetical protein
VVEVCALLGKTGGGLLAVEEDEADLGGAALRIGQLALGGLDGARCLDDDGRARGAVVGADDPLGFTSVS